MAAISENQIVGNLRKALVALEAERDDAVERTRQAYQSRIDALKCVIAEYTGDEVVSSRTITEVIGGVGEDKLQAVREYLAEHQRARQATIADDLQFNTGTVSVALRHLKAQGEVRPGYKEQGSRVWEYVQVPAVP